MPPMRRFSEIPQSISSPLGSSTISRSDVARTEKRSIDNPHPQPINNYGIAGEELDLDPINALLRAGEIVNRNSRERQLWSLVDFQNISNSLKLLIDMEDWESICLHEIFLGGLFWRTGSGFWMEPGVVGTWRIRMIAFHQRNCMAYLSLLLDLRLYCMISNMILKVKWIDGWIRMSS